MGTDPRIRHGGARNAIDHDSFGSRQSGVSRSGSGARDESLPRALYFRPIVSVTRWLLSPIVSSHPGTNENLAHPITNTPQPKPKQIMSTRQQSPKQNTINEADLNTLVGGVLQDLGGAFSVPLVQIGESLGLYQTLSANGPLSSEGTGGKDGLETSAISGSGSPPKPPQNTSRSIPRPKRSR
jgi:hypothetical protein